MEILYSQAAKNKSKKMNLELRGFLYEAFYLSKLKKWNVFHENEKWCEAGVGHGNKFERTQKKFPKISIIGVDNCKEMIDVAIERNPDLEKIICLDDIRVLETIPDSSLDGIMFYQILHHFNLSELKLIFETARKKIKPGGKIVVIDSFNLGNPIRKIIFSTIEFIYAATSFRSKEKIDQYKNCPLNIFIEFAKENGFKLTNQIDRKKLVDRMKFFISEPLVFKKIHPRPTTKKVASSTGSDERR